MKVEEEEEENTKKGEGLEDPHVLPSKEQVEQTLLENKSDMEGDQGVGRDRTEGGVDVTKGVAAGEEEGLETIQKSNEIEISEGEGGGEDEGQGETEDEGEEGGGEEDDGTDGEDNSEVGEGNGGEEGEDQQDGEGFLGEGEEGGEGEQVSGQVLPLPPSPRQEGEIRPSSGITASPFVGEGGGRDGGNGADTPAVDDSAAPVISEVKPMVEEENGEGEKRENEEESDNDKDKDRDNDAASDAASDMTSDSFGKADAKQKVQKERPEATQHIKQVERPTATLIDRKTLIYTNDVANKKFHRKVQNAVDGEADALLRLKRNGNTILHQVRNFQLNPPIIKLFKQVTNPPDWLTSTEWVNFNYSTVILNQCTVELKKNGKAAEEEFSSTKLSENPLIKSGKFGPEVEEFTMQLPLYFPQQATMARHALRPNLQSHEVVLSKLKKNELPSTLDDVYEPTIGERMTVKYH